MFTGIIEEVGHVAEVLPLGGGLLITVSSKMVPELRPDQSIAVNGVCQTVTHAGGEHFTVVAVEETLRKTTLGNLCPGDPVNLERAMLPTGRLDGHIVQGHVDTTGTIESIEVLATSRLVTVAFEPQYSSLVIPVGSVALDGISLTVARLEGPRLTVAIIPHTYEHTIVFTWAEGRKVNIEFDMIGKYVARLMEKR